MAGYTRQSLAQILNGEIVSAPPLNAEFNQILAAFNNSTGHKHDGTAAEGPPIDRIADLDQNNLIFVDTSANQINFYVESSAASVGQISIQDGAIVPFTDNDIDLGSSSFEFKDLYIDGTANIDSLVADTADINAGTIDNTVIGATTPAAATFTNLTVSTGSTINFSGATVSNGGTFTTVTISGGSITGITDLAIADGGTGASTASAARTNLGVAIGTDVQAYDAGLQSISGLTTTADQMIYTTSSDTYATTSLTSAGRALLDDASASAQRTTLGLGTLATQNANSVAITGGTISGISNISDPGTSLPYTFSTTTTDSDPGSGIVRFNNATQNAATEIYIDDEDNDGTNVSGVIALLAGGNNPSSVLGYVTIRKEFAPENFITMKITTLTSASGYTKLVGTVEASSGATPFSDTDNLYFSIDVSGDKGDPGDLSGPASSTDNAIVRWDGTSGSLVQNSSVVIDDSGNVGIGTTSPGSILELASTGPVLTLNDTNGVVGGSQTSRISFEASGTETGTIGIASGAGFMSVNNKSGSLSLLADSNNTSTSSTMTFSVDGSEAARITSGGNFVIGNSTATNLLEVFTTPSAGGSEGLTVRDGTRSFQFGQTGSTYSYNGVGASENLIYASGNTLRFLADGQAIAFNAGTAESMRITSAGLVGIGTSSPSALLDVDGTTRLGGAVSLGGDLDMSGYDLTVDFSTIEAAGEHAEENDANATGTITIQATDPTVLRRTLTGDVTLHVAGAPTPGKGWSTELRTTQDGTGGRDLTILPVNELTYSADLQSTAEAIEARPWTDTRTSLSLSAAVGPDGRTTLQKLIEDATTNSFFRNQTVSGLSPNQTLTMSIVVRDAGDGRNICILLQDSGATGNNTRVFINPATGAVVSGPTAAGNATAGTVTVTTLANSCYRVDLTCQPNTSGTNTNVTIFLASGSGLSYAGDGSSGVYIGNVQVNPGQPVGMIEVGATRAGSVVWRGGAAAEIDYAAQAAAAESRIIIGVGSDGEILIDDVSVET
jgi:hypothetical protein